jgi:lipoprotein-anchoring transpeptidase ErfK/SrfK
MQSFPRKIQIQVDISTQRLELREMEENGSGVFTVLAGFPVSTSGFGLGCEPGSYKTPTGRFTIAEMIGQGAPLGAIFKSRLPTGEIGLLSDPESPEDRVQTRILWLDGLEPSNANTRERYIYIHGTNHEERIGIPCSHGCIRMRNADIAQLFDLVVPATEVVIS